MWAQKLTVVFVLISVVLRVISNYYYIEACEEREEEIRRPFKQAADNSDEQSETRNRSKAVQGR